MQEVLDQWYSPDAVYFKVRAHDQNLYILKYSQASDEWSLESFRQGSADFLAPSDRTRPN